MGRLTEVINPNGKVQVAFTYDAFDRVASVMDSEGYTVHYFYDAADRLTRETFPDGTSQNYLWENLDLISATDRLGNKTSYAYDAVRNLVDSGGPTQAATWTHCA